MSEMEAESLAKMVELEGELVEVRRQKEDLENMNSKVSVGTWSKPQEVMSAKTFSFIEKKMWQNSIKIQNKQA